jgi:hypothetical protein
MSENPIDRFKYSTETAAATGHVNHSTATPISPLATTHADFDWQGLAELLGEEPLSPEELKSAFAEVDRAKLCRAVREIFQFCLQTKKLDQIGRRFIALCWVVDPSLFNGISASQLAREHGVLPVRIHEQTGAASRAFGLRSHAQDHSSGNWKPANA